jgi:hypothetical protein
MVLKLHNYLAARFAANGQHIASRSGLHTDWIEKCLAHEQRGVRAVYNKAEYREQRTAMLQDWANMIGANVRLEGLYAQMSQHNQPFAGSGTASARGL